jgi:hypothetical protein
MRNIESTRSLDAEPSNRKLVRRRQSFHFDTSSSLRDIQDDTMIEFLFKKVPSCRHRRSSGLSRDELIQECEKRILLEEQHDDPGMPGRRKADSIEKGRGLRAAKKTYGLIARLLLLPKETVAKGDADNDDASPIVTAMTYHGGRGYHRQRKESKGTPAA